MKLVRYGPRGNERPGVLDDNGQIRDLSSLTNDIDGKFLSSSVFRDLDPAKVDELPRVPEDVRMGPPIGMISKIVGFGINYFSMARERGMIPPEFPIIFLKAPSTISGPFDAIRLPQNHAETVWEVELGLVVGRVASNISVDDAFDYVAGYVAANDLTETSYGRHRTGQWWLGKNFDTFTPIGPWLVTKDDILDPHDLKLYLEIDGTTYQRGHTGDMIFKIPEIVSFASSYMTLLPGDLILTGSPAGVGSNFSPPIYLHEGNVLKLGVTSLGEQTCRVTVGEDLL